MQLSIRPPPLDAGDIMWAARADVNWNCFGQKDIFSAFFYLWQQLKWRPEIDLTGFVFKNVKVLRQIYLEMCYSGTIAFYRIYHCLWRRSSFPFVCPHVFLKLYDDKLQTATYRRRLLNFPSVPSHMHLWVNLKMWACVKLTFFILFLYNCVYKIAIKAVVIEDTWEGVCGCR